MISTAPKKGSASALGAGVKSRTETTNREDQHPEHPLGLRPEDLVQVDETRDGEESDEDGCLREDSERVSLRVLGLL